MEFKGGGNGSWLYQPEIAGTVGAILAFMRAPGETSLIKAFNLLAGIACAIYGLPLAINQLGIESQAGSIAFSFILGLVGMNLVAKTIDWANQASIQDFWALLERVRGSRTNEPPRE